MVVRRHCGCGAPKYRRFGQAWQGVNTAPPTRPPDVRPGRTTTAYLVRAFLIACRDHGGAGAVAQAYGEQLGTRLRGLRAVCFVHCSACAVVGPAATAAVTAGMLEPTPRGGVAR